MGFGDWCGRRWNNVTSAASWGGGKAAAGYNATVEATGDVIYHGAKLVGITDDDMTKRGTAFSRLADAGEKVQADINKGNVITGIATGVDFEERVDYRRMHCY